MTAQPAHPSHNLHPQESHIRPHMAIPTDWSLEEDIVFENALAEMWGTPEMLKKACERLPHRSLEQVQLRFKLLEEDVVNIDAGRVPLPNYASAQEHTSMERRKGIPWTEEEHRLFLMGLAKFGKGDWRSISRNFVISRTPTQVASHAQKYFIRLNSLNKKDKRRSSIHDITSPGGNVAEVTGVVARPGHPVGSQPGHPMPGHLPVGVMNPPRPAGPLNQPAAMITHSRPPLMHPRPAQ